MMMVVKNYTFQGVEYMVCSRQAVYVPGPAAMELLADRRHGVGADRILLVDVEEPQSMQVFTANGSACAATAEDWRVFACFLRQAGMTATAAVFARALGDRALVDLPVMMKEMSYFEAHVTTAFCRRLAALDKETEILAC